MSVADRLTFARAVSPDPYSDQLVASVRAELERDREEPHLTGGGRFSSSVAGRGR